MTHEIIQGDCLEVLPTLAEGSMDCVVTDPPYGIGFMGKAWDKALPDPAIWRECLRVLKSGGFAAVMCAARSDCTWRLMRDLEEAGFDIGFSFVGWTYANGFPKGLDVGKAFDAEAGAEREVIGPYLPPADSGAGRRAVTEGYRHGTARFPKGGVAGGPSEPCEKSPLTAPATALAQQWDGWKGGRQATKPALEPIIIAQKPTPTSYPTAELREALGEDWGPYLYARQEKSAPKRGNVAARRKLFALCREHEVRPFEDEKRYWLLFETRTSLVPGTNSDRRLHHADGAKLLWERAYSDTVAGGIAHDVAMHGVGAFNCRAAAVPFSGNGDREARRLNDPDAFGKAHRRSTPFVAHANDGHVTFDEAGRHPANLIVSDDALGPERSRFFSLDAWAAEHLPAVMDVPKPSKAEKEAGCEGLVRRERDQKYGNIIAGDMQFTPEDGITRTRRGNTGGPTHNPHPTVKPVALMAWLCSLICPPGGTVIDPFAGSGTTGVAAEACGVNSILIEREAEYCEIMRRRVAAATEQGKLAV